MKKILKTYLNRLTNLTSNNRSILLLRPTGDNFLDINELDFQNGQPSFSIIESLIGRKPKIKLLDALDSRSGRANEISNKLKRIARQDKFITDERGAKDLYVGWPFIKGKLLDETNVRGPLIFFPVELILENNQWFLSLRKDENIILNKSFLLAYAHFNKIILSEELMDINLDEWDRDPQIFRTSLYTLLKDNSLIINFNQDLFINTLLPFHYYKKDEFEAKYETGELKLFPEAVLGIFPQAGSYLVPDYNFLLEQDSFQDLEEFFFSKTNLDDRNSRNAFHYLNKVKEEHTFTPFKMDASQENSIKAVKKGNSLVVQGPPGSGKSQLIANLISDYIARGKKVLMVCQKRAALDVVFQRLQNEGLADFVALVHDFKNDRKAIYAQVNSQIERLEEYEYKNNSLDAIYLERMFLQCSRKIDQITEELEEFKKALFDISECGLSVKELYLTSDKNGEKISIKQEFKFFTFDVLDSFLTILGYYLSYAEKFEKTDYLWKDRVSFKNFTLADFNTIKDHFTDIPETQRETLKQTHNLLGKGLSIHDCERLLDRQVIFKEFLQRAHEEDVFQTFKIILNAPDNALEWIEYMELLLLNCYEKEGPESSLQKDQLGAFQQVLALAKSGRRSLVKRISWAFSKEKDWVKKVLLSNELNFDSKGIAILTKMLDNRMNLEHQLSSLKEKDWIINVPEQNFKIHFQGWLYKYKQSLRLRDIFKEIEPFLGLDMSNVFLPELNKNILKALKYCENVTPKSKSWLAHFRPSQIDDILENPAYAQKMLLALNEDFDSLAEYDQLHSQFKPYESVIVKKLLELRTHFKSAELVDVFTNNLKLAWVDHIELKYPILRAASTLKLRQLEKELQNNVKDKLRLSKEILLLKVRERTYKEIEVNRLNNLVTYRDLSHQITKKRMIWPIRKLMAHFSNEVFNLVPCWMASPEAVSAIFPMEAYFDLVIFDEASQCYAENGIPAIYRGKQIVITGDDKQLSPSDIYKSRYEQDDDEIPETQIDSLLDLGSRYLMQTQLLGHYRSRSLELIDFSNHHFYNGKLSLLPHFDDINNPEPPIQYIKVDGIWEENFNKTEATIVVHEIFSLISQEITDIGVVTFNFTQQSIILNILEAESLARKINIPSSIFVKNIENAQGDERDVIIFSIGYAPDIDGKLKMNFGSLNAQGGENRLNVAVTRARKKVIIVSSIYAQQLKVEDSKHDGPKLLKKYLQYSLEVSEGKYEGLWKEGLPKSFNTLLKNKLPVYIKENSSIKMRCNALPFSDLVVLEGDTFKAIILTDDDLYHQSLSIKDWHVYNKLNMKDKGWKFRDFYSREFWNNRESLIEEYLKHNERLEEG